MKRAYSENTVAEDVKFFTGKEVEQTPVFGMPTLFVVDVQSEEEIRKHLTNDIEHIFFGANQSFSPASAAGRMFDDWENMIYDHLAKGYWCSLDIPSTIAEKVIKGKLNKHTQFIPQITVAIPHVKDWNENAMLKIDDIGFNKTNPGIWTHSLKSITDDKGYTPWDAYNDDEVIK